ncbi:MAG: hypothetical protein ABW212_08515 [Pseudonocardia sediminis]
MSEEPVVDYAELRQRFPWVGLADSETLPAASRYREVMERAHTDREALDALDEVRRGA